MRITIPLSCLLITLLGAPLVAQTPKPAPPAQPATQPAPAPAPVRRRPAAAATPVTVTMTVLDKTGSPLGDASVSMLSDQPREAKTTAGGIARFLTVKPGEYHLRFDREGFVSLERDLTVKGGAPVDLEITLAPMPAPPAPKAPEPTRSGNAPAGDAKALSVVDFLESNHLSGRDPIKSDQLGCTASSQHHASADPRRPAGKVHGRRRRSALRRRWPGVAAPREQGRVARSRRTGGRASWHGARAQPKGQEPSHRVVGRVGTSVYEVSDEGRRRRTKDE